MRSLDMKRFDQHVVRRVHGLALAKQSARAWLVLLFEDPTSSFASQALHAVLATLTFGSTVLLVMLTTLPWSSPDHVALSLADLACGALLLAELIIRCVLWVALSCSKDEMLRSLLPPVHWLFVDGLASTSHVVASTLALMEVGDELAVDMASCLRTLRLISLVRSFSAAELVLDVLRQSAHALKGPMYCCSVYSVLLGITIYYVETLSAPEDEEVMIDTLANAFWYCWVTFSTVGYGDITPTTWLGKLVGTLGIVSGMLWFAMPITIIGSTFQVNWDRRNVRVVADALQTELLEKGQMTHDLYKKFCEIDNDGSGQLDEDEFARFLTTHRRLSWMSPAQASELFRNLDPNNNGYVSYKELTRAVFPGMDVSKLDEWGADTVLSRGLGYLGSGGSGARATRRGQWADGRRPTTPRGVGRRPSPSAAPPSPRRRLFACAATPCVRLRTRTPTLRSRHRPGRCTGR